MNPLLPDTHLIIGPGPIGLSIAALLFPSLSSEQLSLVYRNEERFPVLPELTVHLEQGSTDLSQLTKITVAQRNEQRAPACCWITTKAYHLPSLFQELSLDQHSPVILACNGLGVFFEWSSLFGRTTPCIRAAIEFGASSTSKSEISIHGKPTIHLASIEEWSELTTSLGKLLTQAGFDVHYPKDIATLEWEKATLNIVVNSVATLAGKPNGCILSQPELLDQALHVLSEVKEVARHEGFELPTVTEDRLVASLQQHGDNVNSVLVDLRRGNETELPYLLGRFLNLAEIYGIAVPVAREIAAELEKIGEIR